MSKPDLMLLHGALGSRAQFSSLEPVLGETFRVHTLDFEGHGDSPLKERVFRDDMVGIEESTEAYRTLPKGELQIFPATPHPLEKAPFPYLAHSMVKFFT